MQILQSKLYIYGILLMAFLIIIQALYSFYIVINQLLQFFIFYWIIVRYYYLSFFFIIFFFFLTRLLVFTILVYGNNNSLRNVIHYNDIRLKYLRIVFAVIRILGGSKDLKWIQINGHLRNLQILTRV